MYLKAYSTLFANDLVIRLWVRKSKVGCSNPSRAAYCNFIYNSL